MPIKMKTICLLSSLIFLLGSCEYINNDRLILGRSHAKQELWDAQNHRYNPNVIDYKSAIIKDSLTAIKIAEPILFGIYGEKNITAQRPYEVYLIDNNWVLMGTISKHRRGGTFLIILDAMDSRVVKIIHGK